jgi:peptidoglycan hydrolase-like protein with peptidoglycan-binding domain
MNKIIFLLAISLVFYAGCGRRVTTEEEVSLESEELSPNSEEAADVTISQLQAPQSATTTSTTTTSSGTAVLSLVPETPTVEDIQKALKNAGFYAGNIDGKLGPKTKKAIEEFQAQNSLKVDGKVGKQTWSKLKEFYNNKTQQVTSSEKTQ